MRRALLALSVLVLGGLVAWTWWPRAELAPTALAPRPHPAPSAESAPAELTTSAQRVAIASAVADAVSATGADAEIVAPEHARPIALAVRVVDRAGLPRAGVPIELADRESSGRRNPRTETDADGRASFADVGGWLSESSGPWLLGVARPFDPPAALEFGPRNVPTELVTLVLPDAATLIVRCAVAPDLASLVDRTARAPRVSLRNPDMNARLDGFSPLVASDWDPRFELVPTGVDLVLEATLPSLDPVRSAIPRLSAGEERALDVVFELVQPLVIARLLVDGAPLSDAEVRGSVRNRGANTRGSSSLRARTDADGRVRLEQDQIRPGMQRELDFHVQDGRLRATVVLPKVLPRVLDLGDVELVVPPLVASGRVVDPDRDPLAGIDVSLRVRLGPRGWTNLEGVTARSDAEGRFELRGHVAAQEIGIDAHSDAWCDFGFLDRPPLEVGATDVELVLEAKGGLTGTVVLPPGVPMDAVAVHYQRTSGSERRMGFPLEGSGRFEAQMLPAGVGRLVVAFGSQSTPVLTAIEDVVVPPGEIGRDARLEPLDLSHAFEVARFRVVNAEGEPLTGMLHAPEPRWYLRFERGDAACPRVPALERVWVASSGYRSLEIDTARVGETVVLAKGIAIELRCPALDAPEGTQLFVQARQGDVHAPRLAIALGDSVEWRAPLSGRWELDARLSFQGEHFPIEEAIAVLPRAIDVADGTNTPVTLAFDAPEIERLLATYRR